MVMAIPDIHSFEISKYDDFIALASDGIFDKLTDEDVSNCVYMSCKNGNL